MVCDMRENGKTVNNMAKQQFNTLIVIITKVKCFMDKDKALVKWNTKMEFTIKVNGNWISLTV